MAELIALSLLKSLAMTLVLELVFAPVLGLRKPKDFLLVLLVNVLTNPLVGLTLDLYWLHTGAMPPWYLILVLEAAAVLSEALLYRKRLEYTALPPLVLSLILNGISYFGGWILS